MNKWGIDMGNRLSGIILAGGIVAAGFCLAGLGAGNTSALDLSVNTPADPILEVSLSSSLVQLDLTPSMNTADFKTADLTVTAGTNNITGYTLYMDVDSPDLTRTEAINNTTPVIASLAENEQGYTEANFTANSWGYHIGSGNFLAIPAGNLTLSSNTSPSNGNSTTVTFASKVDMSQPAGSYSADVDIIAIANPILELQDVDNWEGSIAVGQVVKAKDTRDNKYYTVSRLADGRLWFLDNLALDLTDTDVQSNLTAATTNASATSLGYLKNGGGTTSDQYATSGVANWTSGVSYSDPLINMESENIIPSNAPVNSYGTNKTGGYYNYCAASAGSYCYGDGSGQGVSTGNATEDICPAGWRLPTSTTSGEYQTLATAVIGPPPSESNYYSESALSTAFRSTLSLPLQGYFINGSVGNQGDFGYFWSSMRYDDDNMYNIYVDPNNVSPSNANGRYDGFTVRCIAKKNIKVTFNANGGTGTMPVQNLGETGGTLATNTFTNSDMTFTGWNTAADGSGTPYANGATYNGPSTTLYAQWKALPLSGTFDRAFYDAGKSTVTVNNNEYYTMQDMSTSICGNVGAYQESSLVDIRDNKIYTVGKIGTVCWMTQNINIGSESNPLNPETSNVTRNYNLPASSKNGFNSSTVAHVYNDPVYGGYYSFRAAAAGLTYSTQVEEQLTEDICPKNWYIAPIAVYTDLLNTYTTGEALVNSPWHGAYSGYMLSNSGPNGTGGRGDYWVGTSATQSGWNIVYDKAQASTRWLGKDFGCAVRCIAK